MRNKISAGFIWRGMEKTFRAKGKWEAERERENGSCAGGRGSAWRMAGAINLLITNWWGFWWGLGSQRVWGTPLPPVASLSAAREVVGGGARGRAGGSRREEQGGCVVFTEGGTGERRMPTAQADGAGVIAICSKHTTSCSGSTFHSKSLQTAT